MQPSKLSRLLYELSTHARATTKELGQVLNMSQQAISYTLRQLQEKGVIQNYQTMADPAKQGLMNIIVLYTYRKFSNASNVRRHLSSNPNVTRIEDVSQGADLLVEYCAPNLSFFNKMLKDFLYGFKDSIALKETYIVIVKHHYTKNYLHPRSEAQEVVISGDRDSIPLTQDQQAVLAALVRNAREPLANIAKELGKDPKTVARLKKQLERHKVIRRYSIIIDHEQAGIDRRHLLLTLVHEDEDDERKLLEYCKQHKNITALTKTIGPYDLIITVEKHEQHKSIINDLRKQFLVADYRIMEAERIIKYDFLPQGNGNNKA